MHHALAHISPLSLTSIPTYVQTHTPLLLSLKHNSICVQTHTSLPLSLRHTYILTHTYTYMHTYTQGSTSPEQNPDHYVSAITSLLAWFRSPACLRAAAATAAAAAAAPSMPTHAFSLAPPAPFSTYKQGERLPCKM